MPTLTPLTPAHTLLAPLFLQPSHALESWLALGLHRPGQSEDGETDQTVFLNELAQNQSLHVIQLGQTGMTRVAQGVVQLMQHGSSPFVPNSNGVDGFDLVCWWENLELTRVLLSAPDRPKVDTLMNRKPAVVLGKPKLMPPTQWAAWALQDRGDELHEAHLQGGHWPQDILGWAHPQLIQDLLDWGAPWSNAVMPLWAQRARTGDLDIKDVERMRVRCVRTFGEAKVQDAPKAIRNGQDLIAYLQKNKAESWSEMREQAGDMRSWTVDYKDGQGHRGPWPLLGRLVALIVADKVQSKTEDLVRFVTHEFEHLAGDPNQALPNSEHTLGALVQAVIPWLKHLHAEQNTNNRRGFPDIAPLEEKVQAWSPDVAFEQAVACADAISQKRLLAAGQVFGLIALAEEMNKEVFTRAEKSLENQIEGGDRPAPAQWAIQRLTHPDTCGGFWDHDRLKWALSAPSDERVLRRLPFCNLELDLSPAERLRALTAMALKGVSGFTSLGQELVQHAVEQINQVTEVQELRDLLDLIEVAHDAKGTMVQPILQCRPRLEARLRELTTAPLVLPDSDASTARRRLKVRS